MAQAEVDYKLKMESVMEQSTVFETVICQAAEVNDSSIAQFKVDGYGVFKLPDVALEARAEFEAHKSSVITLCKERFLAEPYYSFWINRVESFGTPHLPALWRARCFGANVFKQVVSSKTAICTFEGPIYQIPSRRQPEVKQSEFKDGGRFRGFITLSNKPALCKTIDDGSMGERIVLRDVHGATRHLLVPSNSIVLVDQAKITIGLISPWVNKERESISPKKRLEIYGNDVFILPVTYVSLDNRSLSKKELNKRIGIAKDRRATDQNPLSLARKATFSQLDTFYSSLVIAPQAIVSPGPDLAALIATRKLHIHWYCRDVDIVRLIEGSEEAIVKRSVWRFLYVNLTDRHMV
jgi:hypothetical protein